MAPQIQFTGYNKLIEMAEQVFDDLDLKDGKKDGKISKDIWNQYAEQYKSRGVETTSKKNIKKDDAVKIIATKVVAFFQAKSDINKSYAEAETPLTNAEKNIHTSTGIQNQSYLNTETSDKISKIMEENGYSFDALDVADIAKKYDAIKAVYPDLTDDDMETKILEYIKAKEFAEGSMLPKVEASIDFASKSKGYALITSLKKAKLALEGKTGTVIKK